MNSRTNSILHLQTPYENIGAQDLLKISYINSGWLRWQCKRDIFLARVKCIKPIVSRFFNWRQRFMVLSQGCIYIFCSEHARSPEKSFSLINYNIVRRVCGYTTNLRWCFEIFPQSMTTKSYFFASSSERDMKLWMLEIKNEMTKINGRSISQHYTDLSDDAIFQYIEEPVFANLPISRDSQLTITAQPEESGSDDNYDKILPGKEVLSTPPETRDNSPPMSVFAIPGLPKSSNKQKHIILHEEYYFPGDHKNSVISELKEKEVGSFLVRNSRQQSDLKVLSILTDSGVKEYKIYNKLNTFSLDHKQTFQTVEELVNHYHKNCLPKQDFKLDYPIYGCYVNT